MRCSKWCYFVVFVCLMLFVSTSTWASSYKDGMHAYQNGEYEKAFEIFRPLAEQGNVGSQYRLGQMYALGVLGKQDYALAADWFHKAAVQGDALAQADYGVVLIAGCI